GPGGGARARRRFLLLGEPLEVVERRGPHLVEPAAEVAELAAPRRVVAKAAVAAPLDQAGALEDAEVLRDRAEADVVQRAVDVAGRAFRVPHQAQDLAAARRPERVEDQGG